MKSVTGAELVEVAKERLFSKLGITDVEWSPDRVGHTQVMAGLQVTADDLAKLGLLVLNDGMWCGQQIVSREWIASSTRVAKAWPFQGGFFWWVKPKAKQFGFDKDMFDDWVRTGMPQKFIDKFRPLEGQFFERREFFMTVLRVTTGKTQSDNVDRDLEPWYKATWQSNRRDGSVRVAGVSSVHADGWLGQYIYVYPDDQLVVVRLRHPPQDTAQNDAGTFKNIDKEIDKLLGHEPAQ